jgi:hypothetical protein
MQFQTKGAGLVDPYGPYLGRRVTEEAHSRRVTHTLSELDIHDAEWGGVDDGPPSWQKLM